MGNLARMFFFYLNDIIHINSYKGKCFKRRKHHQIIHSLSYVPNKILIVFPNHKKNSRLSLLMVTISDN